jgi:predicted CXXCH cytochrome family protein
MTQAPTVDNVAAPELRAGGRLKLEHSGRIVELSTRGSELRVRLPDPGVTSAAPLGAYEASFRAAPEREVRVELLTGSHHQQAFWARGAREGELRALPVVYLIAEGRLIPRKEAFLTPPDEPEHAVRWNSNCIQCHAVAGAPAHDAARDVFASAAAELGIACEACHGQGAAHVRAMQNPLERYAAHGQPPRAGVVNPKRLSSERGSQVCGRCHSYFYPKREEDWWRQGFVTSYQPGDDLSRAQLLLDPERLGEPDAPRLSEDASSLFYADGTIRVAGREYNGLVRSPCYEHGHAERRLACTSCHSLHRSEPNDQLGVGMRSNRACTQCHEHLVENVSEHTHHAASSTGSLCYNCHMPQTTYALLGAVRSHRVDSPSFDARTRDRPNACNLCHLDRSEAWAAERAASWYGSKPRLTLDRPAAFAQTSAPAGAVFALAGDAAVRAITAAALGRLDGPAPARELRLQLLDELSRDDYAAVRFIAARSRANLGTPTKGLTPALDRAELARLRSLRDERRVTIAE